MLRETITPLPSPAAARSAGLRYVSDTQPGIGRESNAQGHFRYRDAQGQIVRDRETLNRIRRLAIPPAWTSVWICPSEHGHIQAVGRDARRRKQYRYHERWRDVRDEAKFERMIAFAKMLPQIRRQTTRHLQLRGLQRDKVLAAIVRLLETTLIRVGNDEYAASNRSYGLTTLRNHHARVKKHAVTFSFIGKAGKRHTIDLNHPRLARIVRQCQELPGQELFGYVDDEGCVRDVTSADVNEYLRRISGSEFTAKDFRTWAGTVLAAIALREFDEFTTTREAKRNLSTAIEAVARMLGNTPTICRKCYIHPVILDSYLDGHTISTLKQAADRKLTGSLRKLKPEEAAVLVLLRERLSGASRSKRKKPASSLLQSRKLRK